jgi:hypothetical protein
MVDWWIPGEAMMSWELSVYAEEQRLRPKSLESETFVRIGFMRLANSSALNYLVEQWG